MLNKACICGIGMVTPVGNGAAQTTAAVRAGISGYGESAICNKRSEPVTMALVPEEILPPLHDVLAKTSGLTSRHTRMLRLADLALSESLRDLPEGATVPMFLTLPEVLPGAAESVSSSSSFMAHLATQSGMPIDLRRSHMSNAGRAGGLYAVAAAIKFLDRCPVEYVLVGGVDTYLDLNLLARLDIEDRILAPGIMDGFAPGEGAGFLLLRAENEARDGGSPIAKVHAPGLAREPGHRYSDQPYRGEGLANALSQALASADLPPVRTIYTSVNGEHINAKEWGVAMTRNSARIYPDVRIEHPADCFGDTGAAAAPLLLGLAAVSAQRGTAPCPLLVGCSSEGELRAAACVSV